MDFENCHFILLTFSDPPTIMEITMKGGVSIAFYRTRSSENLRLLSVYSQHQAARTFFYPVCTGYFRYAPGYCLKRNSYDSFLIMYIKRAAARSGWVTRPTPPGEGQIVVLDCYKPHSYYTDSRLGIFVVFTSTGPVAREYFQMITADSGPILHLKDHYKFDKYLNKIYQLFRENASIKEALISQYITNVLTALLVARESNSGSPVQSEIIEETAAYMSEHLTEPLTLEQLASRAS